MAAAKKEKTVNLKALGRSARERSFTLPQATEILSAKYAGWELADDKYIFEDGSLRPKPSTGANKESEE